MIARGSADELVAPEQMLALERLVGTQPDHLCREIAQCLFVPADLSEINPIIPASWTDSMANMSAGILMYRRGDAGIDVLLVHSGRLARCASVPEKQFKPMRWKAILM